MGVVEEDETERHRVGECGAKTEEGREERKEGSKPSLSSLHRLNLCLLSLAPPSRASIITLRVQHAVKLLFTAIRDSAPYQLFTCNS